MTPVQDLRRLALIGDSVFAVSITLNARAVTIPKLVGSGQDSMGFNTFFDGVFAVLLSVLVASAFWLGHWRYFRHVRNTSSSLIAVHFLFLLALIVLPISTDLYATNRVSAVATFVYSLNLLSLAIIALAFRFVAVRHSPVRNVILYDWIGLVGVITLFAIAVALSFRSPPAAQLCWYIGLASPLVEAFLSRRIAHQRAAVKP